MSKRTRSVRLETAARILSVTKALLYIAEVIDWRKCMKENAPNTFTGIVQKGVRRGTELGYPTANIPLRDTVTGVYAATIKIGEEEFEAATFADPRRAVLEAYILDFDKDIYGYNVTIRLLKKIRNSKSFDNDKMLRAAIARDIKHVREFFSRA
jgi:riboflavin kinase / FMN adenylyltransferase